MNDALSIALVIRSFNEEAHIGRLLTGVLRQERVPDEIVLVDSGSTDATLSIASAFPIRTVSISPEDFSFGHALNVGIGEATSDVIVLASAHVFPLYQTWIQRLVEPFDDTSIALSYGRQVGPRDGSFSERRLLAQWFPPASNPRQTDPFCNNANAAIRRSEWEGRPYDEQLTGLEDLSWAKSALDGGRFLAYRADAPVVHGHHESFAQTLNRYRREAIAHKAIYHDQRMGLVTALRLAAQNIAGDLADAGRSNALRRHARDIVRFRSAQFLGTHQGFAQEGPVPALLKRRFYYPAGAEDPLPGAEERMDLGQPIDYEEPQEHR